MISVEKPLAAWKGKETYEGEAIDTLTVIFRSGGCAWNRCRMCGYRHERYRDLAAEELSDRMRRQVAWVQANYRDDEYRMLKIFTSGSFFDPAEVPPDVRDTVASAFAGKLIIAETRPEYISSDAVAGFIAGIDDGSWDQPLYVAMGLETTDNEIREKCIDKGFAFQDFIDAAGRARQGGAGVKTYLMMKPPFLTEKEAIDDMHRSIAEAAPYSDMISMNLCTVQSRTDVERYWKSHAYRPPYLWSVLEVLLAAQPHVMCDPVGGGTVRGPHNCGSCDRMILDAIRDYSLTGDRSLLRAIAETDCACKKEWEFVCAREKPYCMPLTR
ncbi:MAG: archaeosine biosynthesis radical SAM protein RaSEA [Methanomicrobiales archaeon]|nr:archaeosine biosynthesis radical SAM protein RaSEA [Methanomicrobiales archaeon]